MRFARIEKGEKSISDLVSRLFDIKGPKSKERAEEARAAIVESNPHLKGVKNLSEGTIIVLPEIAGIKSFEEFKPLESLMNDMLDQVRQSVIVIREKLEASVNDRAKNAENTLELLKDPQLKARAKKDPAIKQTLAAIAKENKDRIKEAKALNAFHNQAIAQLESHIDDFAIRTIKGQPHPNETDKSTGKTKGVT